MEETTSFWATYKDIINVFVGSLLGIFLSVLSILFTYRYNLRNRITRELYVKFKLNFRRETGGRITEYVLLYEIHCTNSEEISLNYIYLKIPKKLIGNLGPNPTLDEVLENQKGKFFIKTTPEIIKFSKIDKIQLNHQQFLDYANKGKFKKVKLVVNTNKYGNISSEIIKL